MFKESIGHALFNIGDEVVIVCTNECAWGRNTEMDDLVGVTTVIKRATWSADRGRYCYRIEADNRAWSWDYTCFEDSMIKEFEVADSETLLKFVMS